MPSSPGEPTLLNQLSSPRPVIGTTIAHYRVIERLGEGGMGEVFLVEDLKLQRRAALKLIAAHLTRDETRRQRFLQEARLAASIDHPHIAAIHDIGQVDDRTYIAMEYVEGRSLREVLRTGPLKLRRAIDFAIQAGDALAKVHERGVVHRDLKPDNLLIANDGYVKIIDFGLAKLVDPLARSGLADGATMSDVHVRTADGVVLGTMGYMSPEQVRGELVDARSDVFSFGAVLYEMVTGHAPFRKNSSAETISAILGEAPAPPRIEDEATGAELQRILRKCLAKDPTARYQGMRDLVVDLRALRESMASGETAARSAVSAVAARPLPTAPTSTRRLPTLAIVAAVAVIVVTGVGYWAWRGPPSESGPSASNSPVRPSVAVLSFEVVGGSADIAWLSKGLPSMLVTGLAQTPDVEVVGNERLADAARQIGAASLDAVDRSRMSDLAKRAGAHFVLSGTILQAGADLRIDARVEDLTTGAVRVAQSVRGVDAFALADDLAARVRAGLGVQVASSAVRKVTEVASSSMDAYRAFTAGREAFQNVRTADARRLFEEAIRLDPDFALAHYKLSGLSQFEGRVSEQRQHLEMAAKHLDRLPERDRQLVRAALEDIEGRLDRATPIYESLVGRYPETVDAWFGLAGDDFENPERALRVFERGVAALPYSPGLLNMYGYELLRVGRSKDAIAVFEKYVKLRPTEPNALDSLAEAYLISGDAVRAVDHYRESVKAGNTESGVPYALAVLGRYEEALREAANPSSARRFILSRLGRYDESERELATATREAEQNGSTEIVAGGSLLHALLALERGDYAAAQSRVVVAEQTLSKLPSTIATAWYVFGDLLAGTCDARSGRVAAAQTHLARAKSRHRPTSPGEHWWVQALDGEIALALGSAAAAEKSFAAGETPPKMWFSRGGPTREPFLSFFSNNLVLRDGRARAAAAQGRLDDAIAMYRNLLTPGPNQKWTAMLDPLHVLALARLLDKAGQRDAARVEYQRFLDYWKDADKGLPQLAEAKAGLAK